MGVLVAISIPILTSQLEKAREATDLANLRAAKAAAVSAYLSEETVDGVAIGSQQTDTVTMYYDAAAGKLVKAETDLKYGKGTSTVGNTANKQLGYDPAKAAGSCVKVQITKGGDVTVDFQQS